MHKIVPNLAIIGNKITGKKGVDVIREKRKEDLK